MIKICTKCKEEKSTDDFPNEASRKDGKYPWCRECLSLHRRGRYVRIPRKVWIEQKVCSKCKEWKPREEYRKYAGNNLHYRCISCEDKEKELVENGLTECSECKEAKPLDQFYKSRVNKTSKQCISCQKSYHRREDVKLRTRDTSLKKYFGINLDEYIDLMKLQQYTCPICLHGFEEDNYSYPVDHAHGGPKAGVIRAILHDRCNRFVMANHVDPEQLRRAADLMENPLTNKFVPEEFLKSRKAKRSRKTRRKVKV